MLESPEDALAPQHHLPAARLCAVEVGGGGGAGRPGAGGVGGDAREEAGRRVEELVLASVLSDACQKKASGMKEGN